MNHAAVFRFKDTGCYTFDADFRSDDDEILPTNKGHQPVIFNVFLRDYVSRQPIPATTRVELVAAPTPVESVAAPTPAEPVPASTRDPPLEERRQCEETIKEENVPTEKERLPASLPLVNSSG